MALTGTFDADFTAFLGEIDKAKDQLATLKVSTDALSDSVSQVVDDEAPAEMNQLAEATERGSQAASSATVSWQEWAKGLVTAEVIIRSVEAAWGLLTDTISDGISQALEAEDAQAALVNALEHQGTAVPSVIAAFDDYAAALQQTTVYSADAVNAAERILVQIGDVMPRDMERALKATTDLAAALGIDLERAATMVAKAAQGQTSALKATKIEFDETTGTAVDFTNILTKLEDQYSGTAETMAKTAGGQMKQAENAWNELKQSIAETITKNETVRTVLGDLNRLFTTNTGELTNNATANTLVSEAVILLVKGFGLAVEAIDYFQQQLHEAMKVTDLAGIGFLKFYQSLQKIEIATQQGMAALGSAAAIERVREATEALAWAEGAIKGYRDHMAEADKTSQAWSAGLATLRTNLSTYAQQLEVTKGKLHDVNAAQAEAPGVWNQQTGAMAAQTMALQEHTLALDLLGKGYVKIGTDVTALAKARETAAMAEVAAAAKATDEFWKLHAAEEQWQLQQAASADQTVAAVTRIAETVVVQGNAITQAMQGWTAGQGFVGGVGQLPTPTAGYNPATDAYAPWLMSTRMPNYLSGLAPIGGYSWANAAGGGTNVTVNATYPIMDDPRAMDSLARTVGDALMTRLSRSGTRF